MFYSPFENVANKLEKIKQDMAEEKLFFAEDLACEKCKTRLSDLLETGYVGCANCYSLFQKDIVSMVYDFHKAVKHTGKRPDRVASKARKQQEIDMLLKQQAEASANEDYILAQSIKEKISKLRGEL